MPVETLSFINRLFILTLFEYKASDKSLAKLSFPTAPSMLTSPPSLPIAHA